MKRIMQQFFLSTALSSALLLGQTSTTTTPPTPPTPAEIVAHKVAYLTSLLTLTSAQQSQATAIYTASVTATQDLATALQTARQQISDAIKTNNSATITTASATIGTLTTQITATNGKADAAFYALLSADQQAKLNSSRGGFGGFGGRPGPGPGRFGARQ